ncbi:anaphase-promoting complex, cyclosome, subunit 4-domain-containing protein [Linnemannia elongata]|nr:anaphase-promoting complex, cyclosome, subunit 4-domain-containing protein [Linnemannia elongata]
MTSPSPTPMQHHTSAQQEATQNTFYPYSESQVPISHKLEAWCPSADLIALVNNDNKLELYRLSWRIHWSVTVKAPAPSDSSRPGTHTAWNRIGGALQHPRMGTAPAKVLSLTWRPDGKAIAVGLVEGGVNIYDYRDGSLISCIQPANSGSVHCLKWTDIYLGRPNHSSIFGTNNTQKSTFKALPMLSPIPPTSAQQQMMERTMFNKNFLGGAGAGGSKSGPGPEEGCSVLDEETSPIMNALLSGDDRGRFMLRLFEGFDMDAVSLLDLLRIHGTKDHLGGLDILKADVQLDLSEINIIARGIHVRDESGLEPSQQLLQVTLNSGLLDNHSHEIRMLGLHKRPMKSLLQYLNDGLQVMKTDYKKISIMAEDCVESLQKSLTSNDVTTTPTYEFIQMLLTGRPSESMEQYLQQELNTHDLKRWDKSVKAAYKNLQRVAFECLLPACERLMVILSDLLGFSRWTEQYGPLRLDEVLVYNCIIIVGDFMGVIEELFQAIKVEMKQFSEFENWLEQVLEKLHPPARGPDDPADEGQKDFPPVDVKGVSQYLKAGLTNNGLERFFREADEPSASNGDQEAGVYNATPMYPIVYSFSDELRAASALKNINLDIQPPPLKKTTNPFAGAAIAAAMAGRGFGSLPPKKSPSVTLFTKSSASTVQPSTSQPDEVPVSPTQKPPTPLTLERHLGLMTTQCYAIFDGPQTALGESMKVTHVVDVLIYGPTGSGDIIMQNADSTDGTDTLVPKFATRYCYNSLLPWHYLVVCLGPRDSIPGSLLVVLRSRRTMKRDANGCRREQDNDPSLTTPSRKRKVSENIREEPNVGSGTLIMVQPIKFSSTKPKTEQPTAETSTGHEKQTPLASYHKPLSEQDLEIAVFSLQEHDSARSPSAMPTDGSYDRSKSATSEEMSEADIPESVLALAKMQSPPASSESQPSFEVRDLTFLDDNSLCILLNSSKPAVAVDNASRASSAQDDQFVVSVPLLTPNRPYQPVSALLMSLEPADTSYDCVIGRLVHALDRARLQDTHATTSSVPCASGAINVYTLPIDRSRCVTPLDGQLLMDVDSASRPFSFLKPTLEGSSLGAQHQHQQQQDRHKSGPTRIACNDRDKGQVISVHSHNKISVLDV